MSDPYTHSPSEEKVRRDVPIRIIGLVVLLAILWNYWLPLAQDFFNLQTKPPAPANVDFFAYYNAGLRFERGDNPYYWDDAFSDYIYPPTFLPIFQLLSKMSYNLARHIWLGLNGALYIAALTLLGLSIPKDSRLLFTGLALILTLISYPLLFHIRNGQSDLLVISIILLSYVVYTRGKPIPSAILLSLAALLKVSPVLLLITYVVFHRDLRYLLTFTVAGLSLVLFSLLFVPFELYPDYALHILPEVSGGTSYWLNQSLAKLFGENPLAVRAISATSLAGFTLFAWWMQKHTREAITTSGWRLGTGSFIPEVVFCLNLLVILLVVGKVWSMTYVWMILPSALLLSRFLSGPWKLGFLVALGMGAFLLQAKVYGFPGLDSLNLIGNLFMSTGLILWLLQPSWMKSVPDAHEQTAP